MRAEPPVQIRGVRGGAVMHGDTGRDAHGLGPDVGVVGGEQFVGQGAGGGAVAGDGQSVGEVDVRGCGAGAGRGTVQAGGLAGLGGRGAVDQVGGQQVVDRAVLCQLQCQFG